MNNLLLFAMTSLSGSYFIGRNACMTAESHRDTHSSGIHLNNLGELKSDGCNINMEKRRTFFLFSNFGKRVIIDLFVDSLLSTFTLLGHQKKPLSF